MSSFLDLPSELHLEIFYALPTTTDALRLARTCSHLHNLYKNRKTKINILRFAANVPSKFDCERECALSDFTRIAPWKWWLRDGEDHLITLTIDYSQFSEKSVVDFGLRDVASICSSIQGFEHEHPIFEFLNQFDGVELRCRHSYETYTFALLKEAAQLQKSILSEVPAIPDDLSTHDTVIALLLNCFVVSHRMFELCCHVPGMMDLTDSSTVRVPLAEAHCEEPAYLVPLMIIQRQPPTSKLPESLIQMAWGIGSTIESTLQRAAQLLLELMIRQDPRHLPVVLYALCIIRIVQSNVESNLFAFLPRMSPLCSESLLPDLGRLYYICSYGGQPLKHNFNREAYANLVDNDPITLEHCDLLRESWLEDSAETRKDESWSKRLGSFHKRIDRLVFGWI